MATQPYMTGFCEVGNHQCCPASIYNPATKSHIDCVCGCHKDQEA